MMTPNQVEILEQLIEIIELNMQEFRANQSKDWRGRTFTCKSSSIIIFEEIIKIIEEMILNKDII